MSRALSSGALASLFASETQAVWLCLLTIEHASLAAPIRLVANTESVVSRGNLFVAYPFEIEMPGEGDDAPTEARLSIDNADRQVLLALRELSGPLQVTLEIIIASSPDVVEITVPDLSLREADWTQDRLSGALQVEDLLSEPLSLQMTPARFPGLS